MYVWIIIDAVQLANSAGKVDQRKPFMVFVLIILVFFFIGWQVGRIDMVTFFTSFGDARDQISRVLWPWERAITFPEDTWRGIAVLENPCSDDPPPPTSHPVKIVRI
jgi:phosphonate transport system permease protein